MLSTAIIRCTSGIGGFAFFHSLSITIRGLTFLNCGTKIYNRMHMLIPVYAVIYVALVDKFEFHQNSMQESKVEYTFYVFYSTKVQVINSSFFHTNHSQYLNPASAAINCTIMAEAPVLPCLLIFFNLRFPILTLPSHAARTSVNSVLPYSTLLNTAYFALFNKRTMLTLYTPSMRTGIALVALILCIHASVNMQMKLSTN